MSKVYFCSSKVRTLALTRLINAFQVYPKFACFTSTKVQILTLKRLFTCTKVQILTPTRLFTGTKVRILTLTLVARRPDVPDDRLDAARLELD
jgi:hypothetical protein